ncbi:glycosyltransferase family 2 protein [Rhizorhabdus argentea]|uniref:glycosyltransferase family 2 protein n=1 Tax=Rhizorhabdus argentea TaxID=1387174 RepID=UPI003BF485DC
MSIEFSVIVPAFNREDLVDETLATIFAQVHPPSEVILVDDGSTDATVEKAAAWPGCKVIIVPNAGAANARHVGVLASSRAWLAFCDSDDLWQPDHLEAIAAAVQLRPDVAFVFTNFVYFTEKQRKATTKFDEAPAGYWHRFSKPGADVLVAEAPIFDQILQFQPIFPSCTAMTRDFYDTVGGYDPSFGRLPSEDLEFTLRCVIKAPVAAFARPTVAIRRHDGNHSADHIKQLSGEVEILAHSKSAHRIGEAERQALGIAIAERASQAIDGAFAKKRWLLLRRLVRHLPWDRYSIRRSVKIAIGLVAGMAGRQTQGHR